MKPLGRPRIGQTIATVVEEGSGLVAKMALWLQQYLTQVGRNPVTTITQDIVGPSPYTIQNTTDFDLDVVIQGGVVGIVALSRDGTNFYTVATDTYQTVRLNPGDSVRLNYSGLPTVMLIPR